MSYIKYLEDRVLELEVAARRQDTSINGGVPNTIYMLEQAKHKLKEANKNANKR